MRACSGHVKYFRVYIKHKCTMIAFLCGNAYSQNNHTGVCLFVLEECFIL
jgi:hypothetical protein